MKGLKHEPEKTAPTSPTLSGLMDYYRESMMKDFMHKVEDVQSARAVLLEGDSRWITPTIQVSLEDFSATHVIMKFSANWKATPSHSGTSLIMQRIF